MSKISYVGILKMRLEYILTKRNTINIYSVKGLRKRNYSWSNALPPPAAKKKHLCWGTNLRNPYVRKTDIIVINLFTVTITKTL